jgi:hypothetical protein
MIPCGRKICPATGDTSPVYSSEHGNNLQTICKFSANYYIEDVDIS